ncbi:MAG: M18 family aminopeptidase [Bacteroidales bacterium]|nr:M18 family aminopeptidase [Bacteroidales bacterium]MCM1414431.1 M18 family aminopeptidase [bacterium]MCM1422310.1 M18 family aminopeptidase [bacterium]
MKENSLQKMFTFIEKSPTSFHAVANLEKMLEEKGFVGLSERERWTIERGGKYYVNRNGSSLIAFTVPSQKPSGFHMTAAHSDSPCFKIKESPEIAADSGYCKLNVEKYGGMILSTWLDRPLSVAGRVIVKDGDDLRSCLVDLDRDTAIIPNLAIHMNRDMNKGVEYNPQTDMQPIIGEASGKEHFAAQIAKAAGVRETEILGSDLFLYNRDRCRLIGIDDAFIAGPRLDDLECAYAGITALAEEMPESYVNLCAVFDNEEVGSGTKQGAASTFLKDVLERISGGLGIGAEEYRCMLADSFLISADNAHAVHPNHKEKADETNRPVLNGGIVIKYHGSQKYATDAYSAAVMKDLCNRAGVPFQSYANRADIVGGSTLGNIAMSQVSVNTVDIGLPQLAMHSALETAGAKDAAYLIKVLRTFYQ